MCEDGPMRTAVAFAALMLALGGVAAGCGGSGDGESSATTTTTTTTTETTETTGTNGGDMAAEGAAVFASAGCGGCHTLAAAGSSGTVGPELDGAGLSVDAVEAQVRSGGGAMPSFSDTLSDDEIAAVAVFVSESSQ
jgi:mono/diheme cytochrome c family protein